MTHQKIPKERPLLFNAPMVRATLDDSKTQTRRVAKLPHQNPLGKWEPTSIGGLNGGRLADGSTVPEQGAVWHTRTGDCLSCPYGQPGDRLWVRETFYEEFGRVPKDEEERLSWIESGYLAYRASDDQPYGSGGSLPWKPSIHMPRWASRILLEIVSVRIERLQDMEGQAPYPGESDALAEGVNRIHHGDGDYYFSAFRNEPHPKNWSDPTDAFRELWESINGAGSWDLNPLVWVIEFKRVTP